MTAYPSLTLFNCPALVSVDVTFRASPTLHGVVFVCLLPIIHHVHVILDYALLQYAIGCGLHGRHASLEEKEKAIDLFVRFSSVRRLLLHMNEMKKSRLFKEL